MEMPVPCARCGEIVELNDCRTSKHYDELVCRECYDELEEQNNEDYNQ